MRNSTGITKHPKYDQLRLAVGVYRTEGYPKLTNVVSGGGDENTPWEGIPQVPAIPINRIFRVEFPFKQSGDVDTVNLFTLNAVGSGSISLVYDTGGTPCAQMDTDSNLNDYTFIQTKIGTTQFSSSKRLWFDVMMKLDSQSGASAKADVSVFLGLANLFTAPENPWTAANVSQAMCFIITGNYAYPYIYESATAYQISSPKYVSWSLDTWTRFTMNFDGATRFFAANDSNVQGYIEPGTTPLGLLNDQTLYLTLGIKTLAAEVSRLKVSMAQIFRRTDES